MAREMKDSGIEGVGRIPNSWKISRLKYVCQINTEFVDPRNGKYDNLPHIGPGNIEKFTGRLTDYKLVKDEGLISGKYHFYADEIVYGKINPQLGKVVFPEFEGLCSADAYAIHTIKEQMATKYLLYYMLTRPFIDATILESLRMGMPKINQEDLMKLSIPVPSLVEQQHIVEFLDIKCAQIDEAIDETRASIEEYRKLKQAVITQAVTKGIRPNRPMKDSGIDWIGEIPSEWRVQRIKTILKLRDERNYLPLEEVNLISLYTDLGVVQHSDLEKTTGNKASNADGYKKVYENDIIVNIILCWMGAIGRSAYTGVTSPAYDIYVPSEDIECQFYHHYFRTPGFSGDCYKRGKGIMAMRWRTYSDQFRDIKVVVPPKQEQREILNYLNIKTSEIEKLISKKESFLAELESYKKSLIYEYVTGKKEVSA